MATCGASALGRVAKSDCTANFVNLVEGKWSGEISNSTVLVLSWYFMTPLSCSAPNPDFVISKGTLNQAGLHPCPLERQYALSVPERFPAGSRQGSPTPGSTSQGSSQFQAGQRQTRWAQRRSLRVFAKGASLLRRAGLSTRADSAMERRCCSSRCCCWRGWCPEDHH